MSNRLTALVKKHRWRALLVALAVVAAALLYMAGAVFVARGLSSERADFTIAARTGILKIRTYCAQRMVWDLPPGHVKQPTPLQPSAGTTPQGGDNERAHDVSISIESDALITVSRSPNSPLLIVVQRGEQESSSQAGNSLGTFTIGDESRPIDGPLYYRSTDAPHAFTLPVWGRATIGDDVPQGSGSAAGAVPLLSGATIRARIGIDRKFNSGIPRKTVIEETLDAGDIVDTHPEFIGTRPNAGPVRKLCGGQTEEWAAVGFIVPDNEAGSLDVVIHRSADAVSVARAGSKPFELSVPTWNAWLLSPRYQIGAAIIAILLGMLSFGANLYASMDLVGRIFGKRKT